MREWKYDLTKQLYWTSDECNLKNFLSTQYGERKKDIKKFFRDPDAQRFLNDNNFSALFKLWDSSNRRYIIDCLIQFLYLAGIDFTPYIDPDEVKSFMVTDAADAIQIKGVDYD